VIYWKDTISLPHKNVVNPNLDDNYPLTDNQENAIPSIMMLNFHPDNHEEVFTVLAAYKYPKIQEDGLFFSSVDEKSSKMISLTDEYGNDLKLLNEIGFEKRLNKYKRNLDTYSEDEISLEKNVFLDGGELEGKFRVLFSTEGFLPDGSEKIIGHSKLKILAYYPDSIKTYKGDFSIGKQTVFNVGEVLFQYTRISPDIIRKEGGFATHFKLTDRSKPKEEYAILEVRIKNSKGEQINYSPDEINDKDFASPRDFALPEDLKDQNLTIEIDYVKRYTITEDFHFEVSLGVK
jgi:hypothetical protein